MTVVPRYQEYEDTYDTGIIKIINFLNKIKYRSCHSN